MKEKSINGLKNDKMDERDHRPSQQDEGYSPYAHQADFGTYDTNSRQNRQYDSSYAQQSLQYPGRPAGNEHRTGSPSDHRQQRPRRNIPSAHTEKLAHKREYIHPRRQEKAAFQRTPPDRSRSRSAVKAPHKGGTPPLETQGAKKKSPVKKIIIAVVSVLTALFIILNIVLLVLVGKVNVVQTGKRDETIQPFMQSDDVKNILIIGSDTRDPEQAGRTDSMIIVSINKKKKEITMTSLMRDMYLPIVGYSKDGTKMYDDEDPDGLYRNKLNAAYVFGGAELLMDTIQYNFGLKIDEYFYIDFNSFMSIIDSLGGITLKVTDEEAEEMNVGIREHNRLLGRNMTDDYLTKGGELLLNGNQALSYARLRNVGNADFQRTQRQRIVLNKIIEKVNDVGPIKKFSFIKSVMENLSTNMSKSDLFFYGYKAPFYLGYTIKELRIPGDSDYEFGTHNGQSTLDIDLPKCRDAMKKAIFS